ncbi:hypothetical protein BHM03_00036145 [Ensete ventricosum]|nr:hypothetical protein BHM03_00036145 [Ensete ventricosum]
MGSLMNMVSRKNAMVINFHKVASRVEFRSIFLAPSRIFKKLANPNVIAHGKSYEHGFSKKHDGHIFCAKSRIESSFDRFFVCHLRNSKYWPFPTYKPKVSRTSMVSQKNTMVKNFARSHA